MFRFFKNKEFRLVQKLKMNSGLYLLGFVPCMKEDSYSSKLDKKKIQLVSTIEYSTENPPSKEKFKEMKKCKHESIVTEEVPMRFDQKIEVKYCLKCNKVTSKKKIEGPHTSKLIELKFAESHVVDQEERILRVEQELIRKQEYLNKEKEKLKDMIVEAEEMKKTLPKELIENEQL